MSRLAVSILGVLAVAGCAGAPTCSLRFDATDEPTFQASVASFKQELPAYNWQLFAIALKDIWATTKTEAGPNASPEDASGAFFARLNGLTYREIVNLADAAEPTTRQQYWATRKPLAPTPPPPNPGSGPPGGYGVSTYNSNFPMYPSGHIQTY